MEVNRKSIPSHLGRRHVKNVCNLSPTEHQGVHKNSFNDARAYHDRIGIWEILIFEERGKLFTAININTDLSFYSLCYLHK